MQVFCSPLRYVQGISASNQLAQQMDAVGMKPPVLLVASKSARSQAEKAWQESMKQMGWEFTILDFIGECTPKEIDFVVARAKTLGVESLVGAGGGKVLDTARAAANICNISIALAPSIASTDAPTSALSVVYDEQGKVLEYRIFKRNPDLVLVDISLIAQAPVRFLAAGIGDALSTYFESDACRLSRKPNMRGGLSTQAAFALARFCFDSIIADGADACVAVANKLVSPALERVVEANTLLSGLGFESSGLAAAHAIHNGLTMIPSTHDFLHGEKVTIGVLTQLALEGKPRQFFQDIVKFLKSVNLPTRLKDLGIDVNDLNVINTIAKRATQPGETIHNEPFPVTASMVADALRAADALAGQV